MICSLIAVANIFTKPDPITEFYPMNPGSEWIYQDTVKEGKQTFNSRFTETAGEPFKVDEVIVIPIESKDGNGRKDTIKYVAEGDHLDVYLPRIVVPATENTPEQITDETRYSVLFFTENSHSWNYFGKTPYNGDRVDMVMESTSKNIGLREYFGKKVECIEVKMKTEVNVFANTGFVPKSGKGLLSEQTAIYARGIGLVELKEKRKLDKQSGELVRKLVSYTIATP